MKILFTNKKNKNNIYFIIAWKHRIKDKTILQLIDNLDLKHEKILI